MKRLCVLLMLLSFMVVPMNVVADVDITEVLNVSTYNVVREYDGLNYNASTGKIEARLSIRTDSWYNIGLGAVEMKFNLSCEPNLADFQIIYNNETLEEPISLYKNHTYIEGRAIINDDNQGSYDVVDCMYLLAYFWLTPEYVDQPTENEWPMPLMGPTEDWWFKENNWTAPPKPVFALAEEVVVEYPILVSVPVVDYVPLETTIVSSITVSTTNYDLSKFAIMVSALCGFIVACTVIIIYVARYERRSAY